jgi:hypothetical protein
MVDSVSSRVTAKLYFGNLIIGIGAYFTDSPIKAHEYTLPADDSTSTRIMFYCKVALGQEMIMDNFNSALCSTPRDHHSVRGVVSDYPDYIVYRFTQALPFLKIVYRIQSSSQAIMNTRTDLPAEK